MDIHKIYRIFQNWFRPRRMRQMAKELGLSAETRVLDIGGSGLNWEYLSVKPQITIVNIDTTPVGAYRQVVGDACQLPFADHAFDLAFSNSVIEHVPDHDAFAKEAMRVAESYYVQTPNYWFPIEPHLLAPIVHFLPIHWRRRLVRRFTGWGVIAKPTQDEIDEFISTTNLLKVSEILQLFPLGKLNREKVLGLTKSLIVTGGKVRN